jgi:peptide/nickel transport system ATP-binding protein/oligopeptide transport system ATP-binding protein
MMKEPLLKIEGLAVSFKTDEGILRAVDDVSFDIHSGEIIGLVGESGCGKSVTALSILRLIASPPGRIESGRIIFRGTDVLTLPSETMRTIRGRSISMIFQEPLSALSPLQRIGRQMMEVLLLHKDISRKDAWEISREWLEKVKIPDAEERMYAYPYQLSGGMQQRIMIAMAMMMNPVLLIADEPTTALDVTIQAQIFQLIRGMKQERTAILLITHDMGVVWEMCDRVLVMYASKVVEAGWKEDLFAEPGHPYTAGLLKSIPRLSDGKGGPLDAIPGMVPSPGNYPPGCRFHDRCHYAFERCKREMPELTRIAADHQAACFIAGKFNHS